MSQTYYLERIQKVLERQSNRQAISYAQTTFDNSPAIRLPNIPNDAMIAIITIEASSTATDPTKCARYVEGVGTLSTSSGMPIGDLDTYEVFGSDGIAQFQIIGIESGKTHTLNVTYYK